MQYAAALPPCTWSSTLDADDQPKWWQGVGGRARVDELLKASDFDAALEIARAIEHPWYRCQALSNVAGHCVQAEDRRTLLAEALRAAHECEDPNRIVTVASWPFKVLADEGLAEDIRLQLEPFLEILSREENTVRRVDALAPLVTALRNGPLDCFYRVLSRFEEDCRVCRGWKGDYDLRIVAPIVDEVDPTRAAKLLELFKKPRMRRLALKEIEDARKKRSS
jgi:hypothetical protein